MFHDYTLTKLARDHMRELLTEKRTYDLTRSRRRRQNRASRSARALTSPGNRTDTPGAGQ